MGEFLDGITGFSGPIRSLGFMGKCRTPSVRRYESRSSDVSLNPVIRSEVLFLPIQNYHPQSPVINEAKTFKKTTKVTGSNTKLGVLRAFVFTAMNMNPI